jgi:glycosyltransferase involved in cell wall biosynthesis
MEYNNLSSMESNIQLRVCQVCAVDFTVEKFLLPLIDGLKQNNYDVTIICSNGSIADKYKNEGYKFININISRSLNIIKAYKTFVNLYQIFKKEKFDLIHFHTPLVSFLGRIAAQLACNSKIVYTAHGFYFHEHMFFIKRYFFILLEKIAAINNDYIFCQSHEDYFDAIRFNLIKKNKISCLGNGVDITKFNPNKYINNNLKENLGIPNNSIVIGIIARLVKEKGYLEFFEAAKSIYNHNKSIFFLIIGDRLESDHSDSVITELQITKNVLQNNLIFLGFRNDTPELISVMDIFCLPSHREGLPRTIIEAMMMGKPVVASNIRGCREEVINNETGLLFESYSVNSLIQKLDLLINNDNLIKEMGRKGRERALKIYDERKIITTQIEIFNKLLSENKI